LNFDFPLTAAEMQLDVIVLMIYFSFGTVPKELGTSNSKGELIDNRIGIVHTQNACRMNIQGEVIFRKRLKRYVPTPK
jgi:hypothetical protein